MIISFSGAQSSGKSTLLKAFAETHSDWNIVPEVTRLVKREFDLPINEQGGDITQTMISAEHLRNAFRVYDNKNTVLDRCSLDGVVYTHWLCDNSKCNLSTYTLARNTLDYTLEKYDVIFYTSPYEVPIIDDGERSVNVSFRNDIIALFEQYLKTIPMEKVVVLTGSVEDRLKQIENTLNNLKNKL